jgi:hypothetical protein
MQGTILHVFHCKHWIVTAGQYGADYRCDTIIGKRYEIKCAQMLIHICTLSFILTMGDGDEIERAFPR